MSDQRKHRARPGRGTEPRRPAVVDGEVLAERYFPRSPLDPDENGVWPTKLRPVRITEPTNGGRR